MLFSTISSSLRGKARKTAAAAIAASALALAAFPALSLLHAAPVLASDLEAPSVAGAEEDGHFLRLGVGKSAVIKLPAEVKDVVVGDPAVVDVVIRNKNTAYLFGRTPQQTNVFFFDAAGQQILQLDLEVTTDTKAIQKLIDRTLPGSKIKVDTVGTSVVLKGTAANAVDAKVAQDLATQFVGNAQNVVNAMGIAGGDQVMLKVRVVEMRRDIIKQLGINLDNLAYAAGKFAFNLSTANPGSVNPFFGASAGYNGDNFDISASIQALETDGVLRTLAEPTLTAISGQVANFFAGGQFPYVTGITCDDNGRNCVRTINYKDFGVKLGFTPTVMTEGRISLKINTLVSEIADSQGALNVRSADTTIELPSGGSMMLAGLIKEVTDQQINGTPGLKDLPVLGALFRSRAFAKNQTELVVIVTPYMVNPVNEKQLATPADRFNPATDRQAILFGRLNQIYGTAGHKAGGVYHGNVGYIIE